MADVGSLEKAEKRAAIKNLEGSQGNLHVKSFCSFPDVRFEENLGRVGISMGGKENLISRSIDLLKNIEKDRLKPSLCPSKNENEIESAEDEIESDTFTISRT
jgi:hypothetical protein